MIKKNDYCIMQEVCFETKEVGGEKQVVFSSLLFLFRYLPIVLILYFIVPAKFKNLVLFIVSLVFYAWGEPVYVVLMLFSTVVDYTSGRLVGYFIGQNKRNKAKILVTISMIINLSLLGFFKYADFLIENVNAVFGLGISPLHLALPIGISFYTFQTMSYTVDVYRGDAPVQKNIISFGAYVALFPQLIAGPIVRFSTIAEQLNHRTHSVDKFAEGTRRFMAGLGKKVLLANNIGMVWSEISKMAPGELSTLTAWVGVLAFAFQIYFDFSGYSDMAIGLGHMFGFHFLENFDYPYLSKSITEFWRRWHISLGTWFREYVYIPLGGNRKGMARQIFNICVVWFLTGLWHGASWNFILWGVYFGALLILEKTFLLRVLKKIPAVFSHIYTLVLVLFSWAIFAYPDMAHGTDYFKAMFGMGQAGLVDDTALYLIVSNLLLFVVLIIGSTHLPSKLVHKYLEKKEVLYSVSFCVFVVVIFVLSVAFLVDASFNPFLYFRF